MRARMEKLKMLELLTQKLIALVLGATIVLHNVPPETPAQRTERREMIGAVVADVAVNNSTRFKPKQLAAMVYTIWSHEAKFEYHVHAGERTHIGTQDMGKARCLGQIQTWKGNTLLTPQQWRDLAGLDRAATRRCADATARYLWEHAKRCLRRGKPNAGRWGDPLSNVEVALLFAAYGAGHCAPVGKSTRSRMSTYYRAARTIEAR
jgi:hypothetical protein